MLIGVVDALRQPNSRVERWKLGRLNKMRSCDQPVNEEPLST